MHNDNKRPNLIFVMSDQLGKLFCSYAGNSDALMPNIDSLSLESASFENAVSVFPLCSPFRSSLMNGMYPSTTGQYSNNIECRDNEDAFGYVLKRNGYQSGYIGKWHLNGAGREKIIERSRRLGFTDYWAAYNWNHDYHQGFYYEGDSIEQTLMDKYQPDCITDMAIEYLKNKDETKPFALFLSYEVPHPACVRNLKVERTKTMGGEYCIEGCLEEDYNLFKDKEFEFFENFSDNPFDKWDTKLTHEWWDEIWGNPNDKYNKSLRAYYAMVYSLDRNIGKLISYMKKSGLDEDTIFVFTADHGEMMGSHARLQKAIFYEEAVSVPLLFKWKDKIEKGIKLDSCINTPDLMPTLLELMNLEIPKKVQGVSFAKTLLGEKQNEPKDVLMQNITNGVYYDNNEWRAIRDKKYTYAKFYNGDEYLFDNENDRFQIKNLVNDKEYVEKLEYYRERIKLKLESIDDKFMNSDYYLEKQG